MVNFTNYDRKSAAGYAMKWALSRNTAYKDYEEWGGDCTNFISQCVHAGGIPFDNNGNKTLIRFVISSLLFFTRITR